MRRFPLGLRHLARARRPLARRRGLAPLLRALLTPLWRAALLDIPSPAGGFVATATAVDVEGAPQIALVCKKVHLIHLMLDRRRWIEWRAVVGMALLPRLDRLRLIGVWRAAQLRDLTIAVGTCA